MSDIPGNCFKMRANGATKADKFCSQKTLSQNQKKASTQQKTNWEQLVDSHHLTEGGVKILVVNCKEYKE